MQMPSRRKGSYPAWRGWHIAFNAQGLDELGERRLASRGKLANALARSASMPIRKYIKKIGARIREQKADQQLLGVPVYSGAWPSMVVPDHSARRISV